MTSSSASKALAYEGAASGPYTDNQAAPLTLFQFTTSGVYAGSLVLPPTSSGANFPLSGEYGSSSEGELQLVRQPAPT